VRAISVAIRGKGWLSFLWRSASIAWRYGVTPSRMEHSLALFATVLRQFDCNVTFLIPSVTLQRNFGLIEKYQKQGIEFAIHGYRHLDHSQLSSTEQLAYLRKAKQAFASVGIQSQGFRSPYLRWNSDTLLALRQLDFSYDSSQALAWNVIEGHEAPAYEHVLDFYGALSACEYPSLPNLTDSLVRIPYSLPDDEALIERLHLETPAEIGKLWLEILQRTHKLGELFTLGLHPERFALCQEPLMAVLAQARSLTPSVWIACLSEISAWWRARTESSIHVTELENAQLQVAVEGPPGTTVLARAVQVEAPVEPWIDGYQRVVPLLFTLYAKQRPFIGVPPGASPSLVSFLRQQGYIVEISEKRSNYSFYFDQTQFADRDQRALLRQIEGADRPLVRLARWPNGARSALAITGDIDALTLWDYGLRFVGK